MFKAMVDEGATSPSIGFLEQVKLLREIPAPWWLKTREIESPPQKLFNSCLGITWMVCPDMLFREILWRTCGKLHCWWREIWQKPSWSWDRKKPSKHEYFSHISKCNPPDVSLMPVSSDETKADPKTFFGEMPSQVAGTRWKNRRL